MAPEVARHQKYTEKVDIYSFGLIMYFMSSGRQPFHEVSDAEAVLDHYAAGNEPRPKVSDCPSMFRPTMEAAWDKVPEKRPSARVLLDNMAGMTGKSQCACTVI